MLSIIRVYIGVSNFLCFCKLKTSTLYTKLKMCLIQTKENENNRKGLINHKIWEDSKIQYEHLFNRFVCYNIYHIKYWHYFQELTSHSRKPLHCLCTLSLFLCRNRWNTLFIYIIYMCNELVTHWCSFSTHLWS